MPCLDRVMLNELLLSDIVATSTKDYQQYLSATLMFAVRRSHYKTPQMVNERTNRISGF